MEMTFQRYCSFVAVISGATKTVPSTQDSLCILSCCTVVYILISMLVHVSQAWCFKFTSFASASNIFALRGYGKESYHDDQPNGLQCKDFVLAWDIPPCPVFQISVEVSFQWYTFRSHQDCHSVYLLSNAMSCPNTPWYNTQGNPWFACMGCARTPERTKQCCNTCKE